MLAHVGIKVEWSGLKLVVAFLTHTFSVPLLPHILSLIHRVAAAEEEDKMIKGFILGMGTRVDDKNELAPLSQLRNTMRTKPYSWLLFVHRVEKNLRAWIKDTMEERPSLNVAYGLGEEQNAVNRLARARAILDAQGDDPLQESINLADQAIGTQPPVASPRKSSSKKQKRANPSFYEKQKSATRLSFGDSQPDDIIDDDEEEEEEGAAHLSTLPSPARSASRKRKRKSPMKKSQVKKYDGRRKWSDEEKRAIKEGIRDLGTGKWAAIKDLYSVILEDRTSGQISVRNVTIVDSLCLAGARPFRCKKYNI
jgi:hypothetical protein